MRGGALPVLVWALLLALFEVIYVIWRGRWLGVVDYGFAITVMVAIVAAMLVRSGGEAARSGPPELPADPAARTSGLPELSIGGPVIAGGAAMMVFSLVFGHFLLYLGGGVLAVGVLRTLAEEAGLRRLRRRREGIPWR